MFFALVAAVWAAKPVTLVFAWPNDDHAIVTQTLTEEVPLRGRVHRVVYQHMHDAHVTREGLGWRLALTHRSSALVEATEGDRARGEANLAVDAGGFTYELGPEGQIVSLDGWAEASRRGLAAFDSLLAGLPPEQRIAMAGVLQSDLSVEALEDKIRAWWWAHALSGRRFKPGRPVAVATLTAGPSPVSSITTSVLRAGVPCVAGGATLCVEVRIAEVPDAAATSATHQAMLPSVSSFTILSTTTLVVEPDTLRPWRVVTARETTSTYLDGRAEQFRREVDTTWAWQGP